MNVLALDTTTNNCSVAVNTNGSIISEFAVLPRKHNQNIHNMIQSVCKQAKLTFSELDFIVVTVGPGSFTGVRLGISVALGIAFGLGIKVIPVSSLACMAMHAISVNDDEVTLVGLDARMGQIYWGIYKKDNVYGVRTVSKDTLTNPENVVVPISHISAVGSVWDIYAHSMNKDFNIINENLNPNAEPNAIYALELGIINLSNAVLPHEIQPIYLRNNVTS